MLTLDQLKAVCGALNNEGVEYVLVGGWAIFAHGYERPTRDIDILVDPSAENITRLKSALKELLPEAVAELQLDDVTNNTVVRLSGEDIILDVMSSIGDVDYKKAVLTAETENMDGVDIPVAGLDTMLELKSGLRDVDKRDHLFLAGKKRYLDEHK